MSVLMRATEIMRRPVVTLAGEDVAEIKDVVYAGRRGEIAGFTLNGRGIFAGPLKRALPWSGVHGLGRDAVMIADEGVLEDRDAVLARSQLNAGGATGNVLGSRVLTDTGVDLGQVTEVIVEVGATADVVGYEIDSSDALGPDRRKVLIPLPDVFAASVEALIVPAAAVDFVSDDLSGFGAAVDEFRARLRASGAGGAP
jgi:uncharacterized protein YrrD